MANRTGRADRDRLSSLASAVPPMLEPLEPRLLLSAADLLDVAPIIGWDGDTSQYANLADATPTGTRFCLLDPDDQSTWIDAEKLPPDDPDYPKQPGTGDDYLCWAAAASNALWYTGWGDTSGMLSEDDVFQEFKDHWTDYGCWPEWAMEWWFDGTDSSGPGGSSSHDGGGGFYTEDEFYDFYEYYHEDGNDSSVMSSIDSYLRSSYGVTLGVFQSGSPAGHAITCWGFNYNPSDADDYYGIWITDSDDSKNLEAPPDRLRYYEIRSEGGKWFLNDYYGSNTWFIDIVQSIEPLPGNRRPELTLPTLAPLSGTAADSYVFNVHYYDRDGDPPMDGQTQVYLSGGESHWMHLESGLPADGTYSVSVNGLAPGTYQHFFRAVDVGGLDDMLGWLPGPYVDQPPGTDVDISATGWDDPDGDGDGYPEAGESVECQVILENIGSSTLTNVQAWLSSSVGNVDITDDHVYYGDITAGDYEMAGDRFNMFLDFASTWYDLPFDLHVTYAKDGQEYWQDMSFTKTFYEDGVQQAEFEVDYIVWDDSERGDDDDALESGEDADMYLYVKNVGNAHAKHVDVMVGDVPEFTIEYDWERYPDLFAGDPAVPAADGGHFTVRDVPTSLSGTFFTDVVVQYGDSGVTLEYTIHNVPIEIVGSPYMRPTWADEGSDRYEFARVSPGTLVSKEVTIENYGSDPLTIYDVVEDYEDTEIVGFTPGMTIPPGSTGPAFTVEINTTGLDEAISRDIEIQSNAHDAPPGKGATQTIRIAGTVTEPCSGTWEETFAFHANGALKGLAVGDTDGDGHREIVTIGAWVDPEVQVFENVGNNQYVERWSHTLTTSGEFTEGVDAIAIADVNGDGKDDIVCGVYLDGGSNGKLFLIQSSADNTWSVTWSTTTNGALYELIVDDSDGDGRNEIIYSSSGHLYVLENRGGTSFFQILDISRDETDGSPYRSFGGMAVGDSDRDSRPEIIFTSGSRANEWSTNEAQFFIYESTSDNIYTQRYAGLSYDADDVEAWGFARVAIGDPDGDGRREIVVGENRGERLIIIESTSDNSWSLTPTSWEYSTTYSRDPWVVIVANVDDDPTEEIVLGFDPANTTGVVIIDGFAADSYVKVWQSPDYWGEVYSIVVDNTDDSGIPRIIVGIDSGSDIDPDVIVYGQVLPIDLSITEAGIGFDPVAPVENEDVIVTAAIWNLESGDADNVVVRFYEGDPSLENQINSDQVISAIPGGESRTAEVTWPGATDEGTYDIYVVVDPDNQIYETNEEGNNQAYRSIVVTDDDTEGPVISNVVVAEYDGDGDGIIGADEQLQISWDVSDPSGIGPVSLWIDLDRDGLGTPGDRDPDDAILLGGYYFATFGPLGVGTYDFAIDAEDADNSPAMSTYTGSLDVVAAEEITVLYDAQPIVDGETVPIDFGSVVEGGPGVPKVFFVRNDGEQVLSLGEISVPDGFTVTGPAESVVQPRGGTTHFTVTLATGSAGAFSDDVTLANSDGDEDPFNFAVSGSVLIPGDADCNWTVELADLSALAFNWDTQTGATWQMGDFDNDGDVDLTDLSILAFNWQRTVVAGAGIVAGAKSADMTELPLLAALDDPSSPSRSTRLSGQMDRVLVGAPVAPVAWKSIGTFPGLPADLLAATTGGAAVSEPARVSDDVAALVGFVGRPTGSGGSVGLNGIEERPAILARPIGSGPGREDDAPVAGALAGGLESELTVDLLADLAVVDVL